MRHYIIKTEKGFVGRFYRGQKNDNIWACDYTNDGLLAIKCPIREVWHQEKLRIEIENYLESKNIPYEVHILEYNISHHWTPERSEV